MAKNKTKLNDPAKKRMGRWDMTRSNPEDKIEVKQHVKVENSEEDDQRFFIEDNWLFISFYL